VLSGLILVIDGVGGSGGPPQPAAAAALAPGDLLKASAAPSVSPLADSRPTRIRIPSIGVDAPMMEVGLTPDREIEAPPPKDKNLAAWYRDSSSPGAEGTSVIVGHVDNKAGPSVFFSLGMLQKDKLIEVPRADGSTAVFSVYANEVFAKKAFPVERVYGDTGQPELRVITCGGAYSKATGYTGNVVVFARLVSSA
jgi:sortase (surface protein transpeptidase)